MVASAGKFALESEFFMVPGAALYAEIHASVFFFSSFYIVYIILNAVLKQYQIAGYRFFLLSLFCLLSPSVRFTMVCEET